jgi:hypothetical protein
MATQNKWRRPRFSFASVVATLALVVALCGGTAYAATTLIKGSQIAPGTITSKNIKAHSLVQSDFAAGQLPAAAAGSNVPAYAVVVINSVGNPGIIAEKGFAGSITSPSSGTFCVPVPPANRGDDIPPLVSPVGAFDQVAQYSPEQCGAGTYEIGEKPAPTSGQGFTIVAP